MKIRLTENQYKRLLKEDDKDFLDGMVNFKNIGNKVDKPIAKLFSVVQRGDNFVPSIKFNMVIDTPMRNDSFNKIVKRFQELMGYTNAEAILLGYNYCKMYDEIVSANETDSWESLIGKPLEFYGKFTHPITVYHTGIIPGYSSGRAETYATDYDDFIDKFENGEVETTDNGDTIDYECYDLYFETNWDHTQDNLDSVEIDDDMIEIDID